MFTPNLELEASLRTLRKVLAQKRAARKAQTDGDLRAFDSVSDSIFSQSENPLLEQSFRAHSVLARLHELEAERQHSIFHSSELGRQESLFDSPDAHEVAAFQRALAG